MQQQPGMYQQPGMQQQLGQSQNDYKFEDMSQLPSGDQKAVDQQ